ncbi:MAG TPA: bifunctional phosphopantothenoylcysteine decarboxylase/phosphopantothenate--cysteine ligase CoaBC [Bryobacteraceae bacterium]|jgi:phosphopantothenoylcysteine decarboxylase/phosphopantothenate--cysteine ligase|nr:bifunctional phosphopantothenoylcysteine decarboxylase/phosphopantothenate--cysteine ligase CoaBC [Bryobacteraceae bacterium]
MPVTTNVALGVGGGIAAYKAAELARALMERGFSVQVVMTRSAEEFVRPLTFAALTGRKVLTSLFSAASAEDTLSSAIEHIRVAQENQILVIAPATADLLAKLAHGLADDLLTTTYLAFTGPVVLAPAMNTNMWTHAATQENIRVLRARGHIIVEPDEGILACGMVGPGRLAEPEVIAQAVASITVAGSKRDLEGETVLITAGPTQEPLDPVRYLSNRSSGKMGYALAQAAAERGARVILVSGPVTLPAPARVELIPVRTAVEMRQAVMDHLEPATMVIKAAAVADYHRANPPRQKVKKTAARMSLELDPTPDILAEVGRKKGDRLLVGFAAETENLIEEARRKMQSKNCDMVVANLVSQPGIGFESDENEVTLVLRTGETIPVERTSKIIVAHRIFDQMMKLRLALHSAQ